jgi:hypothetical protein
MIIKVLAANAVAMSTRIVSPAKYACIRDRGREEVAEPVDIVGGRPSLVAMAV